MAATLALLWGTLLVSGYLIDSAAVRGLLVVIGAGVAVHLLAVSRRGGGQCRGEGRELSAPAAEEL